MNEEVKNNISEEVVENLQPNNEIIENKTFEEKFDEKIDSLKRDSNIDRIEYLYYALESACKNDEISKQYFKYATQYITDNYCDKMQGMQLTLKVILEKVVKDVKNSGVENIDLSKINVLNIGSHIKSDKIIQDVICIYDGKFISIFGIYVDDESQVEEFEKQTYILPNMMNSIKRYIEDGVKADIEKYEDYYIVKNDEENGYRIQIYKEKNETALMTIEENKFEKIKAKLFNFFGIGKKKFLTNMEKLYDTDASILEDILQTRKTKENAKNRMKVLLEAERKIRKSANSEEAEKEKINT